MSFSHPRPLFVYQLCDDGVRVHFSNYLVMVNIAIGAFQHARNTHITSQCLAWQASHLLWLLAEIELVSKKETWLMGM